MIYINRLFKLFTSIIILALVSYTGIWFYSSYKIKQLINEYSTESEGSFKLSYDKVSVTGFPLKIKTSIDNLAINFKSDKPKIESISTYEKVTLETDLLFKSLKISAFGNSTSNGLFADKTAMLNSIYRDGCYINVISNTPNTRKVIKALYSGRALSDIKLSQVSFKADNVVNFDQETKTEISLGSTNLQVLFDRPSDKLTNTFIKLDAQANIIPEGKELFTALTNLPPLSKLSVQVDVEYSSKLEQEVSSTPLIDIKNFKIILDESIFSVNAKIQNDDKGETVFNINFKAIQWDNFLQDLVNENMISTERYDAILAFLTEVEGEDFSKNEIDINLSNERGIITLEDKPLPNFTKSLNKLSTSK